MPTRASRNTPTSGNWSSSASPKVTNGFDVVAGDVIVVLADAAQANADGGATPSASGGSVTWTKHAGPIGSGTGQTGAWLWTGAVGATATGITVTLAHPSSVTTTPWGFSAEVWRTVGAVGVVLAGHSNSAVTQATLSGSFLAQSAVTGLVADWWCSDGSARAWGSIDGTPITEDNYYFDQYSHVVYQGHHLNVGEAGTKAFTVTQPTMRWTLVAVELTDGGPPPPPPNAFDAAAFDSGSFDTGAVIPSGTGQGAWAFAGEGSGVRFPAGSGTGAWVFSGSGDGTTTRSGSGTGAWSFQGQGSGTTVRSGTGTGDWGFTGTGQGSKPSAGTGSGDWGFTGAGSGARSSSGSGDGTVLFTGDGSGLRSASGEGSGTVEFQGFGTGTAPAVGGAAGGGVSTWQFSGEGSGTRVSSGTGEGAWAFAGSGHGGAPVVTPASGSGVGSWQITGQGSGTKTTSGTGQGAWAFQGQGSGQRHPSGFGSGTVTMSGTGTGKRSPTGTGVGTVVLTGSGHGTHVASGSGSGTVVFVGTGQGPLREENLPPARRIVTAGARAGRILTGRRPRIIPAGGDGASSIGTTIIPAEE